MQLQLSLNIADSLHHDLLVRGGPLEAAEAARILLHAPATPTLALDVLEALVQDDRRFCWVGPPGDLLTLRSWGSDDPSLFDVPFVALDLETTGAKAGPGKITEVGAVRIEGLQVVGQFQTLVNPQRPIPPIIAGITGITQSMVADAPRIEEVIPSLLEFLEGAVIVAHNASFDVGFLNYELHRLRSRRLGEGAIDTLPLSRALVPGLANYRLGTVAQALGAPVAACHRALADAQAVAHVFVHLASLLQSQGVTLLSGLRAQGRGSPPSYLDKLPLTRDLPDSPGTYIFLGEEDRALIVGRADRLAEEVRSFFMAGARRSQGLRTAVRLVERIDYEESATGLEAVVREQALLLEHRPPYNAFWTSPESYLYIKAGGGGRGLSLSTTRRAPRWLREPDVGKSPASDDYVIGPFRRRSSAQAAVALLLRVYSLRHCPRQYVAQPCERGAAGHCLCPCTANQDVIEEHDALVRDLIKWLAGQPTENALDPERRADELARALSRKGIREEARLTREACEQLLVVRRAYDSLLAARALNFAYVERWDKADGIPQVRLDLVIKGTLTAALSLTGDALEERLTELVEQVRATVCDISGGQPCLLVVSVPQEELDSLLAVGRWVQEGNRSAGVFIHLPDSSLDSLEESRARLASECRALLAR